MQTNARPAQPLTIVRAFADNALEKGRDRWSGTESPLFADGIHVETNEPAEWRRDGKRFVVSNLASQQSFFRTLAGLSALTGDVRYVQAARDATGYMFDRFRSPCGLLYWGGHTFVDLYEHAVVPLEVQSMIEPESGKSVRTHEYGGMEIKMHLPFYELLFEVAPEETAQFVRAYWNGDIMDWPRLELNRHAPYGKTMGALCRLCSRLHSRHTLPITPGDLHERPSQPATSREEPTRFDAIATVCGRPLDRRKHPPAARFPSTGEVAETRDPAGPALGRRTHPCLWNRALARWPVSSLVRGRGTHLLRDEHRRVALRKAEFGPFPLEGVEGQQYLPRTRDACARGRPSRAATGGSL